MANLTSPLKSSVKCARAVDEHQRHARARQIVKKKSKTFYNFVQCAKAVNEYQRNSTIQKKSERGKQAHGHRTRKKTCKHTESAIQESRGGEKRQAGCLSAAGTLTSRKADDVQACRIGDGKTRRKGPICSGIQGLGWLLTCNAVFNLLGKMTRT